MAAVEEAPCGLSREVTLAVLPRLYMEEVVTELRRRNISTDTSATGNCREHLLGILKDVMEQEYHRADTGASSDLDNSLDVLQMTQVETTPGSSPQNSTTVITLPSRVPGATSRVQATTSVPCSLLVLPASIVQNSMTDSLPSQTPEGTSCIQASPFVPGNLLQCIPGTNVQSSTAVISSPVKSSQIPEGSSHVQVTPSVPCSLLGAITGSNVQNNITATSVATNSSQMPVNTTSIPLLNTLPASCSTFEGAEVTVEFAIAEVDPTQYTVENGSSDDDVHDDDGIDGDDDGITDAAVPVSVTVSENFGWSVSSKDDQTSKNSSERDDCRDLTVHDETSLQKNSESKQVFISQDEDDTPNRKTLKRASTGVDKPFKCGECSYSTFRKGDLARHEIKHTGDMPFKCDECSYGTVRKSDLEKHKIVHTKTFSCELCDFKTAHKSGFSRHLMKDHGQSSDQVGLKKDGTRIKVFKCEECGFSARKKTELALHKKKHTSKKPFTCDHCDYSTPRKSDLVLHKTRHTGDMPFKCDECSYATTRKSSLVRHKILHTAENLDQGRGTKDRTTNKPFKCTECSYSTGRRRELARHNLKHTGNFPYKCDQCEYGTLRKSDLESHKVRHAGDMPFKCTECDYGTGRRPDFDRHLRTHTGQKPFKCGICNFRSAIECNLLRHQQKRHKGCEDLPSTAHDVPNERDNVDKLFKCKESEYSTPSKTDLVERTTSHGSGQSSILDKTEADKSDLTAEETVNNSEADTDNELSDITSLPADCPLNPEGLEEMSKSSEVLGSSEVETSVETEMLTSNQVDQTDSVINNEGTKSTEEAVSSLKEDDEAQEPGTSENDHDTETTESNFTKSFQKQISQGHDSGKAAIQEDGQSKDEDFLRSRSTEGLEQDGRVEKPFKCGECGFSAHRKKDLECHKRTHTGNIFKCAECDYEGIRKSDLVKHMVMHTGDLPHKCDQCSYSSLRKSEIARHKVVHTGKKPFSCLQCDFKSAYKHGLVKHIKLYHSSEVGSPKN